MDFKMSADEFESLQENYIGLCIACGAERDCCEPDARNYECEACGKKRVFGAEELLMIGKIEIEE